MLQNCAGRPVADNISNNSTPELKSKHVVPKKKKKKNKYDKFSACSNKEEITKSANICMRASVAISAQVCLKHSSPLKSCLKVTMSHDMTADDQAMADEEYAHKLQCQEDYEAIKHDEAMEHVSFEAVELFFRLRRLSSSSI